MDFDESKNQGAKGAGNDPALATAGGSFGVISSAHVSRFLESAHERERSHRAGWAVPAAAGGVRAVGSVGAGEALGDWTGCGRVPAGAADQRRRGAGGG